MVHDSRGLGTVQTFPRCEQKPKRTVVPYPIDRRQKPTQESLFTHRKAPAYSGGEPAEETAYSRRRYDLPGTVKAARVLARGQTL